MKTPSDLAIFTKNTSIENSNVAYILSNICVICKKLGIAGSFKTMISRNPFYLATGFPKYFININAISQTAHITLIHLHFIKTNFLSPTKEDGVKTNFMLLKLVTLQYLFGYEILWTYKLLSIYHGRDIVLKLNNMEILKEKTAKGKKKIWF